MDRPTFFPDGRHRFRAALAFSLLAPAGIGVGGGLASAAFHGRQQQSAPSEGLKKVSADSVNPGGTILIYLETTGPTFQLPPSSSEGHSEGAGLAGRLPVSNSQAPIGEVRRRTVRISPAMKSSLPQSASLSRFSEQGIKGTEEAGTVPARPTEGALADSPLGGLGVDFPPALDATGDRAMQPYLEQLRAKLDQAIRFSSAHQSSGMVLLHFVLDPRGRVKSAALVPQGTQIASDLEQEALRGLRLAAPFPPLPSFWSKNSASFSIRVHFKRSAVA